MTRKVSKNNDQFEIKFYSGVIEKSPRFAEALAALGDLYTKKGFYAEGLEVDKKIVELKPFDPIAHYNLACSYSLLEQIDLALKAIKMAIDYGYADFSFLEKDEDLSNLRRDERFQAYYSRVKFQKENEKDKSV